ncbi:MAG: ABC transporter permease subunit, partial [Acholeplasmataceae bacterium]|nr:ABC transporter permease subunit [Acholeplasmataceae bacterium]
MINFSFLKKELMELIRTPKLIIITSVFVFFAIIGPLTAKYMNELLAMFASDIEISFPDPTHLQSWEQFYSNITSISMIVFLILMTGTVVSEKAKGSVYLVLTKNVTRSSFILCKILAGFILFTVMFLTSVLISWYYTWILFDQVVYEGLFLSLLSVYILGIFFTMVAVTISILFKTTTHAALVAFGAYAFLNILTILTDLNRFNPAGSATLVMRAMMGDSVSSLVITNIITSIILTVILIFISTRIFNK